MSFVAYNPNTKMYAEHGRSGYWTHDIRDARTYGRKCDVKNSVNLKDVQAIPVVVITAEAHEKLCAALHRLEELEK